MSPPYEEESTNDEEFTTNPKVIWTVQKTKKWSKVEEVDNVIIKDLIINDKEGVPKKKPKKNEDWTEKLMKDVSRSRSMKQRNLPYLASTISQGYLIPVISK